MDYEKGWGFQRLNYIHNFNHFKEKNVMEMNRHFNMGKDLKVYKNRLPGK